MAKALKTIDITNIPELLRLAEDVRTTNEPRLLRRDSEDVAIVQPVKKAGNRRVPRGKPFTKDDPLWNIVGMARSEGPGDVSENKYKYLAEAYADLHE